MRFEEMYRELERITKEVNRLLCDSGYMNYGECEPEDLQEVYSDPDLLQRYRSLYSSLEKLDWIRCQMEYYRKPVIEEGVIFYDPKTQRYSLNGRGFHCGEGFEVLRNCDCDGSSEWVYTSIESECDPSENNPNKEGYYLTKFGRNTKIEGMKARRR